MKNLLTDVLVPRYELPEGCDSWAIRTVHPDFRSRHGFRWPFPWQWAEAPGPINDWNPSPCPASVGDGLSLANSWHGMGYANVSARTLLLCAYKAEDALSNPKMDKFRVRRAFVVDIIDGERLVREHGTRASLHDANLSYASLHDAKLPYSDLSRANLSYAKLSYADLSYADVSYTDLYNVNLFYANLSRADMFYVDLSYANLSYANLTGTDLTGADMSGANLSYADLSYANLTGADMSGANLTRARLTNANLTDAKLPDNYSPAETRNADS